MFDLWEMLFAGHDAQQTHVRSQGRKRRRLHGVWFQNAHETENGAAYVSEIEERLIVSCKFIQINLTSLSSS